MKKLILAAIVIASFATVANAQERYNPYAEAQARQRAAAQGPLIPWLSEAIRVRIPNVIVDRRSYPTRKYGTPVGWCKTVPGSSNIGRWFGIDTAYTCNVPGQR